MLVDRDDDDCYSLKARLDDIARLSALRSERSRDDWQLVNRIAIEELEAWYFGDWVAVRACFPRVSASIPQKKAYRNADAISGGTWETFERILMRHGYFAGGLPKVEAARLLAAHMNPEANHSPSFRKFWTSVQDALR